MGHTKVISECKGKSKVISPYETQCVASLSSPNPCRLSNAGATGVAGVTGGAFGVKN